MDPGHEKINQSHLHSHTSRSYQYHLSGDFELHFFCPKNTPLTLQIGCVSVIFLFFMNFYLLFFFFCELFAHYACSSRVELFNYTAHDRITLWHHIKLSKHTQKKTKLVKDISSNQI